MISDFYSFVDWLVEVTVLGWNFWMSGPFIVRALLLLPLCAMIVGLIYNTFHKGV